MQKEEEENQTPDPIIIENVDDSDVDDSGIRRNRGVWIVETKKKRISKVKRRRRLY